MLCTLLEIPRAASPPLEKCSKMAANGNRVSELLFIPGPVMVSDRVLEAMKAPLIDHRGPRFAQLYARITGGLRPIFGTRDAQMLLLGSSGTGGLEAGIVNLFAPGDRVLAAPVGVFGQRMIAIARKYGMEVDVIETPLGSALQTRQLADALDGGKYAGVMLTHNETSTGVQNDMEAIAQVLRGRDVVSVVDSVSGMGATAFAMDQWGYDVVVSASQKVLAAPPGVAMVAVSSRAWEAMQKSRTPRFYFDLLKAREFAAQGQTPWTPPVSTLFALDAALQLYHERGAQAAWDRHARYAATIRDAFAGSGLPFLSLPDAHSVTVVAAKVPEWLDAAAFLSALREQYAVCLSGGQVELRGKIVRMGTMGEIDDAILQRGLDAVKEALASFRSDGDRRSVAQTDVQKAEARR